jgi:hypothetical protein
MARSAGNVPSGNEEAWIALAGTIFGSGGLKMIEAWLSRAKRRDDTAEALRSELRKDITELRDELHEAEKALDEWRDKYYKLVAQLARRGIAIEDE